MFKILAETHKIIANKVYDRIKNNYNINLDLKKLSWGSISPDYLPYYKLIRHYKDESIDYICNEIVSLIFLFKYVNLNEEISPILLNYLSKKIGVISHYLCDYTCYPHAYRKTFIGNFRSHLKYEKDLNQYVKSHIFTENIIKTENIDIFDNTDELLVVKVKRYINEVVEEYINAEKSFNTDLDFALNLSGNISCFIVETVMNYSTSMEYQFV